MNNLKRNLLIVLIAGAMSTYSYGMLPSQEDMERAEALAKEKADLASSQATTTTVVAQPIPEGSRSPLEVVLPGEVRAPSPAARVKSELETTVRHGDGSTTTVRTATPPVATPETGDSPASSSDSDREYVSAAEGGSNIRKNVSDSELVKQRATATADDFAQAKAHGKNAALREASAEVPAAAGAKKTASNSALTHERSATPPVEEAILRARDADKTAALPETDTGAGVGLPKPAARAAVTFAEPDPASSSAGLASEVEKMGGSVNADKLAAAAQARKDAAPVDLLGGKKEDAGSVSASSSSDSESAMRLPATDKDVAAKPAALQKDSLLEKVKRNKLKTLALILALAEAADLTQAYFLKTTKEELQDKTLMQKAKIIAQKTYTVKLLGAAKDTALNLKQHLKTFLNKKN